MAAPTTVDAYLKDLPKDQRAALEGLRKQIKALAPKAVEVISYGVPVFKLDGHPLVSIGAASKHCAFYVMSTTAMKPFTAELKPFKQGKGSIQFTPDAPIPATLVKALVRERIAENMLRWGSKATPRVARKAAPAGTKKPVEGRTVVDALLASLDHPQKDVVEAVRAAIMKADKRMLERVKWNAPSFFHRDAAGKETDFAAFNLRAKGFVQLILLFPNGITADPTRLMQGDWKDRREARFTDRKDAESKKAALTKVVKAWLEIIER
jgi:uncharacterized protein YdhG (YjbR/CyaY superfamily)